MLNKRSEGIPAAFFVHQKDTFHLKIKKTLQVSV